MIMHLRIPSRRTLLEENRHLRMTNAELNDAIDKLLEQTEKDTALAVIGDKMAKRLKRSNSHVTQLLVGDWMVARGNG